MLREAMAMIGDRKVETEASGNVTLETVRQWKFTTFTNVRLHTL